MKRVFIGIASAAVLVVAIATQVNHPRYVNLTADKNSATSNETGTIEQAPPICDGTTITNDCAVDGVNYSTYVYHEAVPEKSHTETVTTYKEEVSGYCTLCVDGTYSPSCATGRGACSYHSGVAQWNAPRYRNAPVYNTRTVVDAPAQGAYYEKVAE